VTAGRADLHPLSAFLQSGLDGSATEIASLNRLACQRGLTTGSGVPLSFVPPPPDDSGYEERIWCSGEVATRPGNRHDWFNALIWLAFPRSKAALNRRHYAALLESRRQGSATRGALRDALTQFDECGVVMAGSCRDLWDGLRAHRWREVFVDRRAELMRSTRFVVFGHASHDALAAPFAGLCGKALFVEVDAAWLNLQASEALDDLDIHLADWFDARDFSPRDWQPLPLLGIPGATADNEKPDYYDDARQFRPARTMRPGSSPGNR
jgi:hypothetical protein